MAQTVRLLALVLILCLAAACVEQPGPGNGAALLASVTPTAGPSPTAPPTQTPEGTEDPDEGLTFDVLTLVRSGGIAGERRAVTVLSNGALLVDGVLAGGVAPEVVSAFDAQIDRMGFFRLQSHYGPVEAQPDTYSYRLTVQRGGMSATVTTVDGAVPLSLQRLIDDLLALTPSGPAPDPTADPASPQ